MDELVGAEQKLMNRIFDLSNRDDWIASKSVFVSFRSKIATALISAVGKSCLNVDGASKLTPSNAIVVIGSTLHL